MLLGFVFLGFRALAPGAAAGRMFICQITAGNPRISVRLVMLLTSELIITSPPDPPARPEIYAKIRFPSPEQYGMMSVPSTVPRKPRLLSASSRQIMRNDATRNSPRNSHGAQGPLAAIQ